MTTGVVSVNGTEITYEYRGGGTPLLLIHGPPFDRTMWAPQIAALAGPRCRIIAPDLRGYGESRANSARDPRAGLEPFARDLAALLDHLATGPVVLGGISMGGQIALDFCRHFPDRVRGLLLADNSAPAETEAGRTRRGLRHRVPP